MNCLFCEDPLPEGVKGNYCDETCKDLGGRVIKTKRPVKKDALSSISQTPEAAKPPKKFDSFQEPDRA